MNKIQPGKYQARISDYGLSETKAGNLQVAILLEYQDKDGDPHEVTWFGSLKEGQAREITLETLLRCGLQGNDISMIGDGVASQLLDVNAPVTIAVIEQTYEGKTFMRVQWISTGGGLGKKLDSSSAKSKLSALNLKGDVIAARQLNGIKDAPRKAPTPTNIQAEGLDDFNDVFGPA